MLPLLAARAYSLGRRGTGARVNDRELPALHALSLEPRTARPGETVHLRFRTPNLSATDSPSATVRFFLPPELEALDETAQVVQPVAPGADVVALLRARLATPLDDGLQLLVRAVLELRDEALETNRCALRVRSSAVLDGPQSGVFVALEDDETVIVRAVVCNEGDGPASDLEITAAAPLGCSRLAGEPAVLALPRLEVGERAELRFAARLVAPGAVLVADDAVVRCGDGPPFALAAREHIALAASLAPPAIRVHAQRRGVRIAIAVRNDGWVDAADVLLRVVLPAPLRPTEESIEVDGVPTARRARGAFAHVERSGATTTLRLRRVPARGSVEVELAAAVPLGFAPAPLRVVLDEHEASAEVAASPERELRLRIVDPPQTVEPGDALTILGEIANTGDVAETVTLTVAAPELADEPDPCATTLAAGGLARVALTARVRADLADGTRIAIPLCALVDGEARAHAECTVVVRDRAWLVADEPRRSGEGVAYALRNTGTTTARALRATFGESPYALEPLAPSAATTLVVSEDDARTGGRIFSAGREVLALAAFGARRRDAVSVALETPAEVVAGAAFVVRAHVTVAAAAERLVLRAPTGSGAAYVPGSTVLDGVPLLDRAGDSPLAAEGLVLHGVPEHAELALAWSLLADPEIPAAILAPSLAAILEDQHALASREVAVRGRTAFAPRPAAFGYHVDAYALALPGAQERAAALPHRDHERGAIVLPFEPLLGQRTPMPHVATEERDDAYWFELPLDDERLDRIARAVRSAGGTLAGHLVVIRALLAERETSGDPHVAAALDGVRTAVAELYDRLFVKLRIPGFRPSRRDFEDRALRGALTTLFERLLDVRAGGASLGGAAVRIPRVRVREALAALAHAPYGMPPALRALVALVPGTSEETPLLSGAFARYAAELDASLSRCEQLDEDAYDVALADERCEDLDDARAAVSAALRARIPLAGVA
ncbi:MAG TPA: hypothetical protein VMA36_10840 [Candidatus Limnocylindria bacterium]|nr:hypothetical protein [Candidatus Limnocylindria bacterium]